MQIPRIGLGQVMKSTKNPCATSTSMDEAKRVCVAPPRELFGATAAIGSLVPNEVRALPIGQPFRHDIRHAAIHASEAHLGGHFGQPPR
jgi:hypothetical protein